MIVPYPPAGGTDVVARVLNEPLAAELGQPIIIDNKGGAAGNLGTDIAAKAAPDGYTFLFTLSSHTINPKLYDKLPFDVERDFVPISMAASIPQIIVVHPSVPANNIQELIALAKAQPGQAQLRLGRHRIAEPHRRRAVQAQDRRRHGAHPLQGRRSRGDRRDRRAGAAAVRVDARGVAAREGRRVCRRSPSRATSAASSRRTLPTIAEQALPTVSSNSWYGAFVPAKMPPADRAEAQCGDGEGACRCPTCATSCWRRAPRPRRRLAGGARRGREATSSQKWEMRDPRGEDHARMSDVMAAPDRGRGTSVSDEVAALIARARKAQAAIDDYDQARVDELVTAAGWAIVEPSRNRALAERAVRDTGLGNVDDKIAKNRRKTMGLLRDLAGARSVGIIAEDRERGLDRDRASARRRRRDHAVDQPGRDAGEQHHQRAQGPQRDRARAVAEGRVDARAAARRSCTPSSTASVRRAISCLRCPSPVSREHTRELMRQADWSSRPARRTTCARPTRAARLRSASAWATSR